VQSKKAHARLTLHKALQFLGDFLPVNGDKATAQTLFIVALKGFTHMDVHRNRAQCMVRLGDLAREEDNMVEAMSFWEDARPLFEKSAPGMLPRSRPNSPLPRRITRSH
jgi:hypothetical protein